MLSFPLANHAEKAVLAAAVVTEVVVAAGVSLLHMSAAMEAEDHLRQFHAVAIHTVALLHLMNVTDMALGRMHLVAIEAGIVLSLIF